MRWWSRERGSPYPAQVLSSLPRPCCRHSVSLLVSYPLNSPYCCLVCLIELLDTKTFEKSYYDLRAENAEILDYQLYEMFETVRKTGGMNAYPKPVYKPNEKRPVVTETEAYLSERVPVSDIQLFNPGDLIQHPFGFHMQVRKSQIDHPESGYGVFVERGEILPGTVVALYPGTVYFPEDLSKSVIDHNEYMISRYDDAVIDGRSWDRKNEVATRHSYQLQHINIQTKNLNKFRNPYGIGQYINHPAPGGLPNVMSYAYDFPTEFPELLQSYIPNEYQKPPTGINKRAGTVMHAILLVATKRIQEQEEIFLNYRYNPANPYPTWYAQPDPEEAQRRWGHVKLL